MIIVTRNLMVGAYEHIEITSLMDVDARIKYMERILRVPELKKHLQVLG